MALIFGVLAAVLMLYWPTVQSLLSFWSDTESRAYTHGYLIALLSLGLLLQARTRIAAALIDPKPLAALSVLLAGFVWLVAYGAAIQVVGQLLLPILMWSSVYAAFGWRVARLCLFPLAYLYFAVTVWDFINPVVQWGTVLAVRTMLRMVGIPAYFNEHIVQIPAGTFEIAGGCSGLHFFIVALALAVLLGELRRDSLLVRIKLALLAAGLAVVTNWVRVFTIIVAGHLTDMQHYLVRVSHYYYGWVLFAVAMAVFFFLARRIGEEPSPASFQTNEAAAPPAIGKLWAAGAATFVALAIPLVWGTLNSLPSTPPSHSLLPAPPAGWSDPTAVSGDWKPEFENSDRFAQGLYTQGNRQVEVSAAVYFSQRQGKELGGYGNSVTGDLLKPKATGSAVAGGRPFGELTVVDPAGQSWLLWYGYEVGNRWFVDETRAQLWYGIRSLMGPQLSRALMLRSPCISDCDSARQTLEDFIMQGR